jgi:hypothetical protein
LCDPWIEPLLGHQLISLENFRSKQGFFLCLFKENKLEGKFVLSPTTCYSSLKNYTTRKSEETIEERKRNSKRKNVEAKEEVYSSN